jgi:hypothetical protein
MEWFYQLFPKMRDLPPWIWAYFWVAVALTPFAMIAVHYLSKGLLRLIKSGQARITVNYIKAATISDETKRMEYFDRLENLRRQKRNAK